MTMVHYNIWTDSGGLFDMYNNNYELMKNLTNFRIFFRHNLMPKSDIVDIMADCLSVFFPSNKINTENGLRWTIHVDTTSDKDLYNRQIHKALTMFFKNDVIKTAMKSDINPADEFIFFDILSKFRREEISPINIANIYIIPQVDNDKAILTIDL